MDSENLKSLLTILTNTLEKNDFDEDKQKIQYFYSELKKIKKHLPTSEKLEELQKIEIDLETKYDAFNELSYYFNPVYVKIKNKIHDEDVKKIREENKRKREIK